MIILSHVSIDILARNIQSNGASPVLLLFESLTVTFIFKVKICSNLLF